MKIKIILKSQNLQQLLQLQLLLLLLFLLPTFLFSQSVGISASTFTPDPSAILDVSSTTKGQLLPRMTTDQRNNITTLCSCTPAEGLLIFNTSTKCLETYVNGAWLDVYCADCILGTNAPSATSQCEGTKKVVIQSFSLAVLCNCNENLTQVNFTTTGTYIAADVTKFQLYITSSNTFSSATQVGSDITSTLGAGAHTFTTSPTLANGNTYYFWITADIAASITDGHTIAVNAIATGDLTSSNTLVGSSTAGGTQTLNSGCLATYPGGTPDSTVVAYTTVATYTWTAPSGVTQVRCLVVAGGGSGGTNDSGGGGGGGVVHHPNKTISGAVTVTVGSGGSGAYSCANGTNSVFSDITAIGGGSGNTYANNGIDGGSGGGGSMPPTHTGGSALQGASGGGTGYGNAGGSSAADPAGGGGGARGVGSSADGSGGAGYASSITGSSLYYGGGGGGGGYSHHGTGTNGGGNGAQSTGAGVQGSPALPQNTGAGGGGGSQNNGGGGAGSSGIVIIKYATR